ncbi:MAG: hypothetical protein ABI384_08735, partial [Allobranchiibius sp.]
MATRTRRAPGGRPTRTLIILAAFIIAMFGAIGASVSLGNPSGQWTPKLGLDLEGGRQIVLQPSVGKGQKVTSGQVNQAVDIIRQRVNGNGVTEAQVSTLGADSIEVSLPGNPSQQTLSALAQSSQLFFRAAITSATDVPPTFTLPTPYVAPATPKPTPSPSASASPSSPSVQPSVSKPSPSSSKPSPAKSSGTTANDVLPQAFRAATSTPAPSSSTPATPKSTGTTGTLGASSTQWETRP